MRAAELCKTVGVTRKALRVYEATGLLAPSARTPGGYRVYGPEAVAVVAFIARARRLGFTLAEIGEIVAIRRAGQRPCAHVRRLAQGKLAALDRLLEDLWAVRGELTTIINRRAIPVGSAAVCQHIESLDNERRSHGRRQDVALPGLHRLSRGRDPRR